MKKLINLSILCLITSVLLSSCASNLSIEKRHYNKGYYIAHHNKRVKSVSSGDESIAVNENSETNVQTKTELIILPNQTEQLAIANNTEKDIAINSEVLVKSERKQSKVNQKPFIAGVIKHKALKIQKNIAQVFPKSKKISNTASDGEGLSLFWIVILILLILWAIGFISSGFLIGSIINLLLLVALILLILWLLRVI